MQVTSVDGPLSNLCSLYGLVWKVASEAFRLLITAKMHLLCPLKTSETILPTEECMAVAKLHRAREQIADQHTRITLQRSHKSLKLQQRTDKDLSGPVDFGLVASALSAATSCCDNHRSRKVDHTTLRRLVVFPIASAQFWFSSSESQAAAASAAAKLVLYSMRSLCATRRWLLFIVPLSLQRTDLFPENSARCGSIRQAPRLYSSGHLRSNGR